MYVMIFKTEHDNNFKIVCSITCFLRLTIDYIILYKVFFDKNFSRLYENLINKKLSAFLLCIILDLIILISNIFKIREKFNE